MKKKKLRGSAVTIGTAPDKMTEREKMHYACFKARVFYFQTTGENLPIECFVCEKDEAGDYVVKIDRDKWGQDK